LILSILEHIQDKLLEADDMFSILQQIKIAMSNKNDPYNYGLVYQQQQLQGEQKNLVDQDRSMEEYAGSMVSKASQQDGNTSRLAEPDAKQPSSPKGLL